MEVVAIVIGMVSTLFWCLYYPLDWSEFAKTRWLALLLVHHGCFFATGVMIWLMRLKAVTPFRLVLCALFSGRLRPADRQFGRCSHGEGRRADAIRATDRLLPGCHSPDGMVVRSWRGWRRIGLMTYPLYLIHDDVVGAAILGALMRAGVPYLLSVVIVGVTMIAASWLIAIEAEPRIRVLLDHTIVRYRLKTA